MTRPNATSLCCPRCRREIGHHDRKGGPGFVLRNRYLRVVPETRQIMVACAACRQEIVVGQLVVAKRVAR